LCEVQQDRNPSVPEPYSHGQLREYCFRDKNSGKPIYAVWLAAYGDPDDHFKPVTTDVPISDPQIQSPIIIDVRTGKVKPATWHDQKRRTVQVELKDSVVAIADASYLNWPTAPEAPSGLIASKSADGVKLEWRRYGNEALVGFEIQRSSDWGNWRTVGEVTVNQTRYSEKLPSAAHTSYKVRALGKHSPSAWSNPAWVDEAP
jgi:hypothetical protein